MLWGFSAISFTVAVIVAPSLSLIYPLASRSRSARASFVASFGTAMVTEPLSLLPQPAKAVTKSAAVNNTANIFFIFNLPFKLFF